MNLGDIISVFVSVCSILVMGGLTLATYMRAGSWRETDEGKRVLEHLGALQNEVAAVKLRFDFTPTAKTVGELQILCERMAGLIEVSNARQSALADDIERLEKVTTRIEGHMLKTRGAD